MRNATTSRKSISAFGLLSLSLTLTAPLVPGASAFAQPGTTDTVG